MSAKHKYQPMETPTGCYSSLRAEIWSVVSLDGSTKVARVFELSLMLVIILNTGFVVFQTVDSYYSRYGSLFDSLEVVFTLLFTVEYAVRLWACISSPRYAAKGAVRGRISWMAEPLSVIDFITIFPIYLAWSLGESAGPIQVIRAFRLFRLVALFKTDRLFSALSTISDVYERRKEEIWISILINVFTMLFASSVVYIFENPAQPKEFSSVPATFWWAAGGMTGVGHGPEPITLWGKIFGGLTYFVGVAVWAIPTGVLASGFVESVQARREAADQKASEMDSLSEVLLADGPFDAPKPSLSGAGGAASGVSYAGAVGLSCPGCGHHLELSLRHRS